MPLAVSQSRLLLESIEKKIETLEAERQSAESRIKDSRGRVAVLKKSSVLRPSCQNSERK